MLSMKLVSTTVILNPLLAKIVCYGLPVSLPTFLLH